MSHAHALSSPTYFCAVIWEGGAWRAEVRTDGKIVSGYGSYFLETLVVEWRVLRDHLLGEGNVAKGNYEAGRIVKQLDGWYGGWIRRNGH